MATLIVPPLDLSFPTLGPAVADFIEAKGIFGPGSLHDQPAFLDDEKRGALYRMYEVFPKGHPLAGRRVFRRAGIEWRKGLAKTELAAWIAFAELHPEAPVRCDGFDARGNPVGRPVAFPYIPMMAVTEEQVSELAYGVLKYVVENGPDADLFDASLERILRKGPSGKADGKAVPVSNAPGSRDGALTTFQHFDEPHRLILPSHRDSHETMTQNLDKRPLEDPWALYTSTAGQPGQDSIQEGIRKEAEMIDAGEVEEPTLFFFARWAGPEHDDLSTLDKRIAAISDATGPVGEYGPGQFRSIAQGYTRPGADKAYWERVWLNRWRKSGSQFFNVPLVKRLAVPGECIPDGAFITLGFDGARFRDSTGFVATDIATGLQQHIGLWEKPSDLPAEAQWEVPEDEVTQTLEDAMKRFEVWRLDADPPHWMETVGSWSAKWPDQVEELWTNKYARMAYILRAYLEAMDAGTVRFGGDVQQCDDLIRHLSQAGARELQMKDSEGKPLFVTQKLLGRDDLKHDLAVAGALSWNARLEAIKSGAKPKRKCRAPRRIR